MLLAKISRFLRKFIVNFYGEIIYMSYSKINLDIYTHKIKYSFNKIVNLTKILLNPTCTTVLYKLGLFDSEILCN